MIIIIMGIYGALSQLKSLYNYIVRQRKSKTQRHNDPLKSTLIIKNSEMHSHTQTHRQTHTQTDTHTHTHTHTHTNKQD